jgi:hypothetical protein
MAVAKIGRVNYTAMVDIPEGEQVISKACTQRCQLSIHHIDTPYLISTLGGRVVTEKIVMHPPLNLAGKFYKPSLVVLDDQGLDENP